MKTQDEVFREMTPAQRLKAAERLYWDARRLVEARVRLQHPEWTEDQVRRAVNETFLYARG
jgi:hypothetical protein